MQTNDRYWIKLSDVHYNIWNHLAVCKQMTDVELNCQFYIVIFETV